MPIYRPRTEEEKARISQALKGRHITVRSVTCPHCGLPGGETAMKRWHFDNCKWKDVPKKDAPQE
jgi:uncharacterized metal-binding protein